MAQRKYARVSELMMEIHDCVREAVESLGVPQELRGLQNNFDYDPVCREWGFDGFFFKGPKALTDPRLWVERICEWLQVNYPDGPIWAVPEFPV